MTPRRRPASAQRKAFAKILADALLDELLTMLPLMIQREVDARVAKFPQLRHVGVWDADRQYHEQECVTCDGSMWVARRDLKVIKPGTDAGAGAWQLVVKRGKDGRDRIDGKDAVGPRVPETTET